MGLPVSVVGGTYVPGAETALNLAAGIINTCWEEAQSKSGEFELKIAAVVDDWLALASAPHITASSATAPTVTGLAVAAPDITGLAVAAPTITGLAVDVPDVTGLTVAAPTVAEPTIDIPQSIDTATIIADFDTERVALVNDMVAKFGAFQTAYFPDNSALYSAAEDWVAGALANPNGGLPIAVQNQIIADDHARITAEASRAADAVLNTFAARRFPLPPGVATSAVLQIQQKAQDGMAESSRKITMLSVEMMKFAVEKALGMRQIAMNAALDYIKALMMGPEIASKVIGIGYDAQTKLITAVAGLLGARAEVQKLVTSVGEFNASIALDAKKLVTSVGQANSGIALDAQKLVTSVGQANSNIALDAQKLVTAVGQANSGIALDGQKLLSSVRQFNASLEMDALTKNQAADMTLIEDRLKALLAECQAFAQMSTALYNNLHAQASTSYGVNVS